MENNIIQPPDKEKYITRLRIKKVVFGLAIVVFSFALALLLTGDNYDNSPRYDGGECNVAAVKLQGVLLTYDVYIGANKKAEDQVPRLGYYSVSSESIINTIEEAEKDNRIKAIFLEIDSPGGSVVAAEEVSNAVKRAQKPTVAVIREMGTSAAYWSASGADIIFASANSTVGSIGVTMSYLDEVEKNKKDGLSYNQLSSGKFKDSGSYSKPLSEEEKTLFMRDINIMYENFLKAVSRNRNIEIEKVKELADGSSITGQVALEKGLIDRIGDVYAAKKYLENEVIGEEPMLCW